MKKILLPLVALMLSATAANAQLKMMDNGLSLSKTAQKVSLPHVDAPVLQGGKIVSNKKAMAPAKRKEIFDLTEDQRFVGNSNALQPYTAVGLPGVNATKGGAMLSAEVLKKYAGARIIGMRFILNTTIGATNCSLVEVNGYDSQKGNFSVSAEKASGRLSTTTAVDTTSWNWNMVKFDTPYTIPSTPKDVIIGFTYKQKSTQVTDKNGNTSYSSDCYPFVVSETGSAGGFCIYATANNGVTGWFPLSLGNSWVDLCAQVIVERDGGYFDDIELNESFTQKFVQRNNGFDLAFSCRNFGSKALKDYTFGISLDNNEIATMAPKEDLTFDEYKVFQAQNVKVPAGTADGAHLLKIYVKDMKGTTPAGFLDDDTLTNVLRVYTESIPHQMQLVEHFTGQACVNCPTGYDVLNAVCANRNDIAWVAIHNYLNKEGDDEYVVDDASYISSYSAPGLPTASFNRYFFGNADLNKKYRLALNIGYTDTQNAANTFSQIIDLSNRVIPAVARVDMTQQFDVNASELTLTVRGTGVKNAAKILAGTRLTVYLTEDGQVGDQAFTSTTTRKYKHDHILRQIVSNPGGDDITWKGDNFEMKYTVAVDEDYDFSKMHAIAFINNPFVEFSSDGSQYGFYKDFEDVWVNNCNSIDLSTDLTDGISSVVPSENAKVVARYAADGTQLSAPVKGINIVKYSDGTTNTVLVK